MASLPPDGVQVRVQEIQLLIVGKSGTGKTSLASALLANESAKECYAGTEDVLVHCTQGQLDGKSLNVYDTRGICNGSVSNEKIVEAIKQNCPVDQLNKVIVCMRWDERLDEADKEVLHCLDELDSEIWRKTVFALTFCDHLPPGLKHKNDDEKRREVDQKWSEWKNVITQELISLGVSHTVVESIRMAPTTHTDEDIDVESFSKIIQSKMPWLEVFWQVLGYYKRIDRSNSSRYRYQFQKWHLVCGIIIIVIMISPFIGFL